MSNPKYFLNVDSGTLHIFNTEKCPHSQHIAPEDKTYNTEDEAIAENQRYMRYCKTCFGGR